MARLPRAKLQAARRAGDWAAKLVGHVSPSQSVL